MSCFVGECCARPLRLSPGYKIEDVLPSAGHEGYANALAGVM